MKKFLILLSVFALAACSTPVAETPEETPEEPVMDISFQNHIFMENVSDMPDAEGEGLYGVNNGETRIYASFKVDDPKEDYFYEGWIICDGAPYTTGALIKHDGLYENIFKTDALPEACSGYVLTIEPDDGDPAPADHVMDGQFVGIAHNEIPNILDWDAGIFDL